MIDIASIAVWGPMLTMVPAGPVAETLAAVNDRAAKNRDRQARGGVFRNCFDLEAAWKSFQQPSLVVAVSACFGCGMMTSPMSLSFARRDLNPNPRLRVVTKLRAAQIGSASDPSNGEVN